MANPNINDKEANKFVLSTWSDVCVDVEVVIEDPLAIPEWTVNDLELKKFTDTGKVRVVLTM